MKKQNTLLLISILLYFINMQSAYSEITQYKVHKIGGVTIRLPDNMEMFRKIPMREGDAQAFKTSDECSDFRARLVVSESLGANDAEANFLRESVSKFPNEPEIKKMLEDYKESIVEIEINSSKEHVKNFKLLAKEEIKLGKNDLIMIEYSGLLRGKPIVGRKYESFGLGKLSYSFSVVDHEACYQSRLLKLVQSIESATFRLE